MPYLCQYCATPLESYKYTYMTSESSRWWHPVSINKECKYSGRYIVIKNGKMAYMPMQDMLDFDESIEKAVEEEMINSKPMTPKKKEEATRHKVNYRYDILSPEFIHKMAQIAAYGGEKYGDYNFMKPGMTGDKSPVNHMYEHLNEYRQGNLYDHVDIGESHLIHLAAIAFNAMMEFMIQSFENQKINITGNVTEK
jgi:hypothetical protein